MIIDNSPWHKKAFRLIQEESLDEYSDIREKMELIKLPPYSPDLNPIEQCWRITRREVTHNTYFANEQILENTLDNTISVSILCQMRNSHLYVILSTKINVVYYKFFQR